MEQVGLEKDLAVGNRDDVGRDVRRQVARLRLDNRQRRQRSAAELAAHLRRALQQARVEIEDVARVRFAAWRAPQQQRNFAVRLRMLRQVVIDAQRMAAAVAEKLPHGARGIRSDIQKRRRIGRAGRDDDAVAERVGLFEDANDLRDRRLLLADRVVNADDVLVALVDDGIDRHRGLPGLAVADDELALTAADGHHRVDRFEARLQRFAHRLAIDDAWRDALDRHERLGRDRTLAVDRLTQRIDDSAEQLFADGHRDDASGALHDVAFLDFACTRRGARRRRRPPRGSAQCRRRRAETRASRRPWHARRRARARCRRRATRRCRLRRRRPRRRSCRSGRG